MKISPIVGTGVPSAQVNGVEGTISPSRMERAKQIAQGLDPVVVPDQSGNEQVDRLNTRRIKMKTNVSTNRQDVIEPETLVQESLDISDTTEPAVVAEETKPLSPQFAALAKAKRALQIEKANFEKEKAELTQKPSVNTGDYISKADLLSKPLSVLMENGVTYDQLTEAIIAQQSGATPEINALRAELKALKEDLGNQFTTRDQQAEQQVLADIQREIIETVKAKPEQYEAIREAKAEKVVKDLIHRTWKTTGEVLDTEKAIELVENQLIDEALPFAKLSKVQKRLTPAQAAQVEVQLPTPKPNTKVMRTLTNRDTASPIMDKRQRAIAAMQGTLKKG
jgi:hypothetical protein